MSTRSCVARRTGDNGEFVGIYSHWDGYPTCRAAQIWGFIHNKFDGDIDAFLTWAIDEHPGGWSGFGEECYCHGAFAERDGSCAKDSPHYKEGAPKGDITHKTIGDSWCEWLYIIDPGSATLEIRYLSDGTARTYDLNGSEPDWDAVEKEFYGKN